MEVIVKLLFISNYKIEKANKKADGVTNKMIAQMEALKEKGFSVSNIEIANDKVYLNENNKKIELTNCCEKFYKTWEAMFCSLEKVDIFYDYIYVRYDYVGLSMLRYLKKQKNRGIKIILEIPTYMRKFEKGSNIKTIFGFYLKNILNRKLKECVDVIATFSDDSTIHGAPTVQIENCINAESYKVLNYEGHNGSEAIHLIGVAMMTPSHGYDRVIKGLAEYYSDRNNKIKVYFHIVGGGQVEREWQRITNDLKLDKYVTFHGVQSGESLNKLFENADIAVGSLAIFRKKCSKCSEIKIREYCARGIPFIYSAYEPVFENKNLEFAFKVSHNESPINIKNVIDFYNKIDYRNTPEKMHEFASENFKWSDQFEKIFDCFGGEK